MTAAPQKDKDGRRTGADHRHGAWRDVRAIAHALAGIPRPMLELAAAWGFVVICAGFFVLGKDAHRLLFFGACTPVFLMLLRPSVLVEVARSLIWWLGTLLCGLWMLSATWSRPLSGEAIGEPVLAALAVTLFLTVGIALVRTGRWPDRLFQDALVLTAGMMAVLALVNAVAPFGLVPLNPDGRLRAIGWATHPGIGGDLYGFAAVAAGVGALDQTKARWRRAAFLAAALACLAFAVLSESRGTVLGLLAAGLALGWLHHARVMVGALALFAGLVLVAEVSGAITLTHWIERGSTYRLDIWAGVVEAIEARPLLGVGAGHEMAVEVGGHVFNSAHNAILGTAYHTGLIGGALFLALTLVALGAGLRHARQGRLLPFMLLVYGLAVSMTHTQSVVINLTREWLIFWIPVILAAAPLPARDPRAGLVAKPPNP